MTRPIWLSFSDSTFFPTLDGNLTVDVAIIGGGITGISTAQLLAEEGLKVAVFEKEKIGIGTTAHSTGNLYPAYSDLLVSVNKKFGADVMNKILFSRMDAITLVEANVNEFRIDCDFKRVPWNYYTTVMSRERKISKTLEKAKETQLNVEESEVSELGIDVLKGMTIHGAAQCNPLRYVQGLANAIESDQCLIYENTNIDEIDEGESEIILTTADKRRIRAKYLVHATHTPKGTFMVQAEMGPYREYGIACKLKGDGHPPGIYFGYYKTENIHSTRSYERNGEKFLIVVSEPHKVGQGDSTFHIQNLEEFAKKYFDVAEITHRWGGQHYRPADYIPYIGRRSADSNVFIATGFSTHGLVYGAVAAQLISDQITGKENPCEDIYKPYRLTPVQSAPHLIKENFDVVTQYVKDYLFKKRDESLKGLFPGEGKVIEYEGHKIAVFKDEQEELQICSAVCTHMGCIVHWNNAEKSWDCPCHGSRFKTNGDVIEGPALKALQHLKELTGHDTMDISQDGVMTDEEKLDEALRESFPASDPLGYRSKSKVDKELHW